jgi:hypothetical protein
MVLIDKVVLSDEMATAAAATERQEYVLLILLNSVVIPSAWLELFLLLVVDRQLVGSKGVATVWTPHEHVEISKSPCFEEMTSKNSVCKHAEKNMLNFY